MPNTVLGKVSVVPRGDYNASTTYYALDIVGYNGGSYLAMKEVTGVTPSNDQTNWMQLSGPGLPGADGTDGTDGVTFTPSVSEAGVISWTNDGGEDNPDPVNIMGPQGNPGAAAGFGEATATVDETTGTPSVEVETSGPDTAKVFSFAFSGLKGETGAKGDTGDQGIQGIPGVAAGFGTPTATVDDNVGTPGVTVQASGPDTAKVFSFAFVNLKGETGAQGIQGIQGPAGTSVASISRTSGTGAAGTTDTYTMYDSNDDAIGTFTVYNGANGAGAGDFMADGSVPMTGPLNMGGNKITNLGAPGADTDAVRKSDLDAVAAEVDGILDGTTPAHLAPATDTKIGGVIIGEGLSVTADGTISADDQLPAGGTQGQVLTQGATGPEWQDAPSGLPDGGAPGQVLTQGESGPEWTNAPDPLPSGGETGQVLTKTASGTAWDDVPSDLPSGGTDGQILTKTTDGVAWEDAPEAGVTSFKGRTGAVTPQDGDYTADMVGARPDTWTPTASEVGAVPTSRTVNGKALSSNITLDADDVGALDQTSADARYLQLSGGAMTGNIEFPNGGFIRTRSADMGINYMQIGLTGSSGGVGQIEITNGIIFFRDTDDRQIVLSNGGLYMQNRPIIDCPSIIAPPDRLTVTLSASGWSGNSQTITVNGVITNTSAQDIDISCADKASADAWAAGGVWCSNPTQANKLTFTCTTPPTANINLNIRLWEVGG